MSDCCDKAKAPPAAAVVAVDRAGAGSCCEPPPGSGRAPLDWLLWGCLTGVVLSYSLFLWSPAFMPQWLHVICHTVFELINTMWWSLLLAAFFVGVLGRIPQQLVIAILGRGGSLRGVFRATLAGVLLDLCSHGILMVGMKLYQKGASLGQVMAFLIASPWNSLSLTLILFALIGLPWTLAFIALSMLIAVIAGWIFDRLVARKVLPGNGDHQGLPEGFAFWPALKQHSAAIQWNTALFRDIARDGIAGSRIVLRWLLFGVLLAAAVRAFVDIDQFQNWFGPTLVGLAATLLAATLIEVCSEGSTPIAADLMTRAKAPGNSFAFLMTGVATDYTEVMVIKDTMRSWKIALFLPLITVPQVVVVALILNNLG